MPSSKSNRDYPSSMYAERGSAYKSSGYSKSSRSRSRSRSSSNDGDSTARRNSDSRHGYNDHRRGRDYRQGGRSERYSRDTRSNNRDSRRDQSYDRNTSRSNRKDGSSSSGNNQNNNNRSRSMSILERFLPSDFRRSQADPEARQHRLHKEKECEGFDWTQGLVLGLIGATALFSVEKSLVRRRKKEYID